MASSFWSIVEAHGSPRVSSELQAAGYAAGLLAWVLAGGLFVTAKAAIDEMPPWTLCFWRLLIATAILVPLVRHDFGAMAAFMRKHWFSAFAIGAIGLALTQGLMFTALEDSSAVTAGIIFSTTPVITLALARLLLGERMNAWQAIGTLVAFLGIVVIAVKGSWSVLATLAFGSGDLLVIGAAVAFSIYTVLLKRAKYDLPRLPLLVVLMTGAVIFAFPFFLYELFTGQHANLALKGYLALAYAAIPAGALMYLLYNWSVDVLGASRAGGLLYTQMVFTALLAWAILGEPIEPYHLAGAGLIVAGVALLTFLKAKPPAPIPAR